MTEDRTCDVLVVSHTHWDREWYMTFEETRFRLMELARRLVEIFREEPDRAPFWLDGQTVVLDDLREVADAATAEAFERLVREGRILIGPWYTLPDELLVGGESQVRNLLMGCAAMRRCGQDNRIGYLPDTFGHISQMPQILLGFGIDNALLWRGYHPGDIDFIETRWRSPSGQSVAAIALVLSYTSAANLTEENLEESAARVIARMRELARQSAGGVVLMLNGSDLAMPSRHFLRILARLAEKTPGVRWRAGTIEEYLREARTHCAAAGKALEGELPHRPQLDGTLSSRPSLKRLNREAERLLFGSAEPLAALAAQGGHPSLQGFLRRAYRLLGQNHAHDTICGCHSDATAEEARVRFMEAIQISRGVFSRALASLAGRNPQAQCVSADTKVALFNPSGWERKGVFEFELLLPPDQQFQEIRLHQAGKAVPVQILAADGATRAVEGEYGKIARYERGLQRYRCAAEAAVPACGFALLEVAGRRLGELDIMDATGDDVDSQVTEARARFIGRSAESLDNGLLRVEVGRDGRIALCDLLRNETWRDLNLIQDAPDPGDLYESAVADGCARTQADEGSIELSQNGPLVAVSTVRTQLRCGEVMCPLEISVTLRHGAREVEVRARLLNRAAAHVARAAFRLPENASIHAHMPFDMVSRAPIQPHEYWDVADRRWRRANSPLQPMQYGICAETPGRSCLYIANRGMYEYFQPDSSNIEITLHRAAGLIRENLAGYEASGANEMGWSVSEYAIGLADDRLACLRALHDFNQGVASVQFFGEPPALPQPAVMFENPWWVLSAIKPAEDGSGLVARFWNASDRQESGSVVAGFRHGAVLRARMDETPQEAAPACLTLAPREVATLLFLKPDGARERG